MLYSHNQYERHTATYRLQELKDKRAIKPLVELLIDPTRQEQPDSDGDVNNAVHWAIASFGEDALPELMKYIHLIDVAGVLRRIGHVSAMPYLLDALKFGDKIYSAFIFEGLSYRSDPIITPIIKQFKTDNGSINYVHELLKLHKKATD
jgi:hypothetical protein